MRELPTKRRGLSLAETKRMVAVQYDRWLERHPEQRRYADPVFGSGRALESPAKQRRRVRVPTEVGDLAGAYLAMGEQPRGTMARMAKANGVRPKALAMAVARERARRGMAAKRAAEAKKFSQ